MDRCDYCEYSNSWDCDDGWNRISNNCICEDFVLDYRRLSDKQKKTVQRILMRNDDE